MGEQNWQKRSDDIPAQVVTTDAKVQSDSQGGATGETGGAAPADGVTAVTKPEGGANPDPRVAALFGNGTGQHPIQKGIEKGVGKAVGNAAASAEMMKATLDNDIAQAANEKAPSLGLYQYAKRIRERMAKEQPEAKKTREEEIAGLTYDEAMKRGDISSAEYVSAMAKKAKAEGRELNPYEAVLMAHNWRDDKTPEERKRQERRDRLGLLFNNLGTLAANAVSTGMAFGGGMPVTTSSEAANKRAAQIEAQRKAAQERMDTALLNARLAMAKTKEEREKLMAKLAASAQEKYLDRASREKIAAANRQSSEAIAKANRESKEKEGESNRKNQKAIAREGNETRLKIAERGNDKWPTVTASMDNNGEFTNRKYNLNNNDDVVHLYEALKKQYPNRFKSEENPSIGEMRTKIMIEVANRDNESDTGISVVTSNDYGRRFLPSGKDNDGSENY